MAFTRETMNADEHSRLIKAGQERAKALGRHSGRPQGLTEPQREVIRISVALDHMTIAHAAELFNVSTSTVRRILKEGAWAE